MFLFWFLFYDNAIVHYIFAPHADVFQILITNRIFSYNAVLIFLDNFCF